MVLGLLSDTHRHGRGLPLPEEVFTAFEGVDAILHAGDLTSFDVLDVLRAYAPVHAVAGNSDPHEVADRLPCALRLEFDGVVVGLTHGHRGRGSTTAARALSHFPDAQVVVFGHSHVPCVQTHERVMLVNPGSPTQRRSQPNHSVARLTIAAGCAEAEIVTW
ncbi:MAG: metallophosphoesterase family protein [Armatimonadetes bacterium]|nr:metallophosphoesterase family protein [Armatimonadota bacterium]